MWRDCDGPDDEKSRRQSKVKNYPNRLGEWMDARGLTDQSLGKIVGRHHNTIYKLRTGDRKIDPYEYLIPFAAVLGCNIEDLLLPDEDNLKLLEEIRTSKNVRPDIRGNVAAAIVRWNNKRKESET